MGGGDAVLAGVLENELEKGRFRDRHELIVDFPFRGNFRKSVPSPAFDGLDQLRFRIEGTLLGKLHNGGEMFGGDHTAAGEQGAVLHGVAKFSDVPRPGAPAEFRDGFVEHP